MGKEKQEGSTAHTQIGFWMLAFLAPSILHFRNIFLVTQGAANTYDSEPLYSDNLCNEVYREPPGLGASLWRIRPRKLLFFSMKCKWNSIKGMLTNWHYFKCISVF